MYNFEQCILEENRVPHAGMDLHWSNYINTPYCDVAPQLNSSHLEKKKKIIQNL